MEKALIMGQAAAMGAGFKAAGLVLSAVLRALGLMLCAGIVILLAVMLVYQAVLDARAKKRSALRRNIREAAVRMVAGGGGIALSEQNREELFSPRGLAELLHLMDEMGTEGRGAMREMLHRLRYEGYVNRQMDGKDPEYLALVIRMVAALDLKELDVRVSDLIYAYPENVGLQYEAFMALSCLGSTEPLLQVCMDREFAQRLSFRSLQQILGSYSGAQAPLYAYLLHAPDPYVVRTCLKLIGNGQLRELAKEVEETLQPEADDNLLMDSIRCLGLLGYQPAVGKIARCAQHPRWEVRAVAATALGQLDSPECLPSLAKMLCDREWQVRYNAGLALQRAGLLQQVAPEIEAAGDAFALDMLRYMTQTRDMWRAAT